MATQQRRAVVQRELRDLSDCGATLPELLNHLEEQNRLNGRSRFSDDQEEELQLYCWALFKGQSSGVLAGPGRAWGGFEDDIGA